MIELITILLAIFVINTIWVRYKTFNKKSYFKKQYKDLRIQLADLEFKRFKTKEGREEIRQYYTDLKAKREGLVAEMKRQDELEPGTEGKLSQGERNRLDDDLVRLDLQIKQTEEGRKKGDPGDYIMNLKGFDQMLNQLNSQIDQIRSLRELIKEYISKEI